MDRNCDSIRPRIIQFVETHVTTTRFAATDAHQRSTLGPLTDPTD